MRVLVIHGYTQNAEILRKKVYWLAGLRRAELSSPRFQAFRSDKTPLRVSLRPQLSAIRKHVKNCEFVFVDAPMILAPPDLEGSQSTLTMDELIEASKTTPELTPRAWWTVNAERTRCRGLDESIMSLRELLMKERFDGIFGFSQGASFAGLMTALLERPHLYPALLVDDQSPHPPFKFCIAVAGFKPSYEGYKHLFEAPIQTPVLHVLGTNDGIVDAVRSQTLIDACANPRVERHDGGHFVPSKASWRNFFRDYIHSFDDASTVKPEDVASPTPGATPGTSVIGTPVDSRAVTPAPEVQPPCQTQ